MTEQDHLPGIVFSVTNCICHDQRVLKIAEVVSSLGLDVTIVGRYKGTCCDEKSIPFGTKRFRMVFRKGFLFYAFFNIRLFTYLLFRKYEILVSNDLDTLPANFMVSRIRRKKLVFDSHEYFTGIPELQDRYLVKNVWKFFERMCLPGITHCLTVSESIAEQYKIEYNIEAVTVRNCARNSEMIVPVQRSEIGFDPDHLILVLQGTGINPDRGAEELLASFLLYEKHSLLIVGSGDILPGLKKFVYENKLSGRVKFIPQMDWVKMMGYTKAADIGLSLDKNKGLNQRFSLPNKLFDYISAGIPVLAGDLPEITRIITDNSCGVVIPEVTPEEIAQAVRLLHENRDLLRVLKINSAEAGKQLSWEHESLILADFYKKVLSY